MVDCGVGGVIQSCGVVWWCVLVDWVGVDVGSGDAGSCAAGLRLRYFVWLQAVPSHNKKPILANTQVTQQHTQQSRLTSSSSTFQWNQRINQILQHT